MCAFCYHKCLSLCKLKCNGSLGSVFAFRSLCIPICKQMHVGPQKVHVFDVCFSFDAHLLQFQQLLDIFLGWMEVIHFGDLPCTALQMKAKSICYVGHIPCLDPKDKLYHTYYVSGDYPPSCLYLKNTFLLVRK
jgi:hypothetical protein